MCQRICRVLKESLQTSSEDINETKEQQLDHR